MYLGFDETDRRLLITTMNDVLWAFDATREQTDYSAAQNMFYFLSTAPSPTKAQVEQGKQLVDTMVERLAGKITEDTTDSRFDHIPVGDDRTTAIERDDHHRQLTRTLRDLHKTQTMLATALTVWTYMEQAGT